MKKYKKIKDFIQVKDILPDIVIEQRYAGNNNFMHKVIYSVPVCVLRENTANKLVKADSDFKKLGYKIKIWDGYRPLSAQKMMWELVKDPKFIANPYNGRASIHNRGCAVDITLVDENGDEIEMPSQFDDFSIKATRYNKNMSEAAAENLKILTDVMLKNGFNKLDDEWWHYTDTDWKSYKVEDIDLNEFLI